MHKADGLAFELLPDGRALEPPLQGAPLRRFPSPAAAGFLFPAEISTDIPGFFAGAGRNSRGHRLHCAHRRPAALVRMLLAIVRAPEPPLWELRSAPSPFPQRRHYGAAVS